MHSLEVARTGHRKTLHSALSPRLPWLLAPSRTAIESRVLVCYSDKGGGTDKLSGEHAPRHAAATLAALGPRTPQLQCDLGDAPLVDGRGDLAPAVRAFLRETP